MADWDKWIGRESIQTDVLTPAFARRWLAMLDRAPIDGSAMPNGIHFCLCTPEAATAQLGRDGHPKRDKGSPGFFPPLALPRRMWAGSDISFLTPIEIGAPVERTSRITSITEKSGRSGKLGFVEVEHLTTSAGVEAVHETQTLVYRDDIATDAPLAPPAPADTQFDAHAWEKVTTVTPCETLLFRFSALTFNTHRIHYDQPYARNIERYRGLVVHGPLIATLLLELIEDAYGFDAVRGFTFKAVSPAIAGEALHLAIRASDIQLELGAFAADGRQTLFASAALR